MLFFKGLLLFISYVLSFITVIVLIIINFISKHVVVRMYNVSLILLDIIEGKAENIFTIYIKFYTLFNYGLVRVDDLITEHKLLIISC